MLEPLRHIDKKKFRAVIFRRTYPQVTNPGGLWDESLKFYSQINGATPRKNDLTWGFPSGARLKFAHLQHDGDEYNWQGAQICFIGFDELTHFCYNPVMETLTETGWKRIADVQVGERVLALTSDGEARYEDVTNTWSFDYEGDLLETESRSIRYSVTPNHKMVIRLQTDEHKANPKAWAFCEAKDLPAYPLHPFEHEWQGVCADDIQMPKLEGRGIGTNQNSVESIPIDVYVEFMGWYLSEGSAYLAAKSTGGTSPCVNIRQTKDCPTLHNLMERFPYRSRYTKGEGYRVFSRQLYEHLKPLGNLYQKRVPRFIMNLPAPLLWKFLNAFIDGDGQRCKSGAIAFGLANEGLIDDLQEVAVKLGHRANKSYQRVKGKYDTWRLYIHERKGGCVQDKPWNKKVVPYKGKVHCITVEPSHTLLVRHEGRVHWSGNSEQQFWYMLSRNRSLSGVRPYVRATTNPDADSWVAKMIDWWIDDLTGYPIYERGGVVRWFARIENELKWADDPAELREQYGVDPKSFTFIPSSIFDNKILMEADPGYMANLQAQTLVEQERLLKGNWRIRAEAGKVFNRTWYEIVPYQSDIGKVCRFFDFAATEKKLKGQDPDYTATVRMRKDGNRFIVEHAEQRRMSPPDIDAWVYELVEADRASLSSSTEYLVRWEIEPGSAGIRENYRMVTALAGYDAGGERATGDKLTRAKGLAAQSSIGNVKLLRGSWNDMWLTHMHHQPDWPHDDLMDASSGAFNQLLGGRRAGTWGSR